MSAMPDLDPDQYPPLGEAIVTSTVTDEQIHLLAKVLNLPDDQVPLLAMNLRQLSEQVVVATLLGVTIEMVNEPGVTTTGIIFARDFGEKLAEHARQAGKRSTKYGVQSFFLALVDGLATRRGAGR